MIMLVKDLNVISTPTSHESHRGTMFLLFTILGITAAELLTNDIEVLNELPLEKLLQLKTSLKDLVTSDYDNITVTTPSYLQRFGAEAMAVQAQPPIRRGDYEEGLYKKGESKIGNIFSISVTTLAFLAFAGYLLCLIVHAVKAKHSYSGVMSTPTLPSSFFIKKRPQAQITSYGRKKRENRLRRPKMLDVPPEQLFSALLQVCEGYAKWSERQDE